MASPQPVREQEKPLHVRVAEALGWTDCVFAGHFPTPEDNTWWGTDPSPDRWRNSAVPRYDIDWAATGPLIERFRFRLEFLGEFGWRASDQCWAIKVLGDRPLSIVCNLLLALKEAGKL